jgi:hypothetical protein
MTGYQSKKAATLDEDGMYLVHQTAQQEPCGWQFYQDGTWHNGMETSNHRANTEAAGIPVRNVYTTPPAAQPVGQAPCAKHCESTAYEIVIRGLKGDIERMKAAQRKPLTDEQRQELMSKAWNEWLSRKDDGRLFAWSFSFEVEAAHGIKE